MMFMSTSKWPRIWHLNLQNPYQQSNREIVGALRSLWINYLRCFGCGGRHGRKKMDFRFWKCACAVTKKTCKLHRSDGSVTVFVLFRRRRILTSWPSVALFWPPLWLERDPILTKRDKNVAFLGIFFVSFPSPYLGAKKEREKKEESSCDQNSLLLPAMLQRIIAIVLY